MILAGSTGGFLSALRDALNQPAVSLRAWDFTAPTDLQSAFSRTAGRAYLNREDLAELAAVNPFSDGLLTGDLLLDSSVELAVIQGDSAFAAGAALAAFQRRIPVGYIMAGTPQEAGFGRFTERLASVFFTPTPEAKIALIAKGIDASRIIPISPIMGAAVEAFLAQPESSRGPAVRDLSSIKIRTEFIGKLELARKEPAQLARILSVFGTRPEIIKFAPIIQELEVSTAHEAVNVCTSQHTTLAAPFLKEFGIQVHHDLGVMRPNQSLNQLCARIVSSLDKILQLEKPDLVLVQGDTTSALAGAVLACQYGIPLGHIEAGLRSGDPHSPFPEEMNRMLIGELASAHFAATERNRETLLREGKEPAAVYLTGNPVVDCVLATLAKDASSPAIAPILKKTDGQRLIVLTAHRRENFGEMMPAYFKVLREFLLRHEDLALVFPIHPNPNVRQIARDHLAGCDRIHLIDPLAYPDFVRLLKHAWLIVSDSGGLQEESPTLRKPLLIIRENTERPEVVECGAAKLIGESAAALAHHLDEVYDGADWVTRLASVRNPFGDGESRHHILRAIDHYLATHP